MVLHAEQSCAGMIGCNKSRKRPSKLTLSPAEKLKTAQQNPNFCPKGCPSPSKQEAV